MPDIFFGFIFIVLMAGSLFWLWMLYDALTYTTKNTGNSIIGRYFWVIVIFFGSFLGMFLYYFIKKRNRPHEERSEYDRIVGKY
ncbi:MAG: PLDc N-terminal domain-containing protein [Acidobacteria bacterium]|nr:PLDc N-terminal domain-containing protein [Acidobacteriota bacterium]